MGGTCLETEVPLIEDTIMNICNPHHTYTWSKTMNDVTKQFEQFAEIMKSAMPQVKPNKNGYEIRTKVLEMAQNNVWQDYHAKWGAFEASVTKEGDEVVTKVELPEVPGADAVLETAQKFYDFVNGMNSKNK
jgi:hypothetical protein